jgi:hypothetical protein
MARLARIFKSAARARRVLHKDKKDTTPTYQTGNTATTIDTDVLRVFKKFRLDITSDSFLTHRVTTKIA